MTRKDRYDFAIRYFRKEMPEVQTELEFGSVFQLLVAVILSAQCTDKRINQVTPELFRHFPDAKSMAKAEVDDVLEYVKSVSYPNSKADHLVVFRVSHRLGLVSKKDDTPYKVEQVLVKNIPMEDIPRAHHWLLLHGRYICTSRRPHCEKCGLVSVCPSATLSSSCDGNGSRH